MRPLLLPVPVRTLLPLALAVVAASAVAQPRPYVAYIWADDATAASYAPDAAYAFNPAGSVTATRSGVGTYAVIFDGFGASGSDEGGGAGHLQVTAYNTTATCTAAGWSGDVARVRCFGPSGAPADARFTALWIRPGGNPGRVGFAWANAPTETSSYLPSAGYAYNAAGRTDVGGAPSDVRIGRFLTGRYRVDFETMGRWFGIVAPGSAGAALVSPYGAEPRDCQLSLFGPTSADMRATVDCTDAAGARADARFTVMTLMPEANLGVLAYTRTIDASAASSTPPAAYSLNPSGSATTVTRSGVGTYLVTFGGLRAVLPAGTSGNAQVTPYGSTAARCAVLSWGGSTDVGVIVQCRAPDGALADSRFQVVLLYGEAPPATPAPAITFEGREPGAILVNEFYEQGVRFPNGLEVVDCTARAIVCTNAASSDRAIVPRFANEFDRFPFVAEFVTPQDSVSLVVNGFQQDGREYSVLLQAFDATGAVVREDSRVFESGPGWPVRLAVRTNTRQIVRAELFVTRAGVVTNAILVDDIALSHPVPPGTDATPPTVTVFDPPTSTSIPTSFQIYAQDDVALDRVSARVVYEPTGAEVFPSAGGSGDLCGGAAAPCPATTRFEPRVVFYPVGDGRYLITATATDAAGNTTTDSGALLFTAPTVVSVVARGVEINQGVAERITAPFSTPTTGSSGTPIVQGKPLLLRYYLFHQGEPGSILRGFTARVEARFEYADGSVRERTVFTNTDASPATLFRDPSPDSLEGRLLEMRAHLVPTLDFVLPGEWTADPDLRYVQLRLYSSALATNLSVVQTRNLRRSVLGLNVYLYYDARLSGSAGRSVPTLEDVEAQVLPYMRNTLPVSEVRVLRARRLSLRVRADGEGKINCQAVLNAFRSAVDGSRDGMPDDAPGWVTNLLVGWDVGEGCSGMAGLGNPEDSGDRSYDSYGITDITPDIALHEVGHTIGFEHASNGHGEGGGGGFEPWPYPHGLLSEGLTGFGAALRPTDPATDTDPGSWLFTVLDPCPGATLSERLSCPRTDADGALHEMMSYGNGPGGIVPYPTSGARWISARNSRRIDAAIRLAVQPTVRPDGGEDTTPAFLVSADVDPDGNGAFGPFLVKAVRTSLVQGQPAGPLGLDLYDGDGALLSNTSLEATELMDGENANWMSVRAYVPFVAGVRRAVLTQDGATILEETASAHVPTVRVLAPNGGEQIASGLTTVRWEMDDGDGDALTALVQYSPDGGASWEGLATLATGETDVTVDVAELTAGADGVLRVVVSDGLNVAEDRSDAPFAFGTPTAGEPGAEAPPTELAIVQTAPNPFADQTRVTFALPEAGAVTVEVFDALGRRVAVLVEGVLAAGTHDAVFDARALSGGIYLVRVSAGGRVVTARVLLAR